MKKPISLFAILAIIAAVLLSGCSSSQQSSDKDSGTDTPPPAKVVATEKKHDVPPAAETKDAASQESTPSMPAKSVEDAKPAPVNTPHTVNASSPTGKYSVQIGAYSQQERADQQAAVARSRFQKGVYMMRDPNTNNMKVLIGDFENKDDARLFRDQLIQQFPEDYKGSWVFEVPHN